MAKKRIAIFISGRGSNMEALFRATQTPDYPAEVIGVLADHADAKGLEFAAYNKLHSAAFERKDYADKVAHEAAMLAQLVAWNVDILCLAGFMRVLSAKFIADWAKPLLNIHPSLLPLFPGLDTHNRALKAGVKLHGCSVHHVTAGVDEGPIIAQAAVPVLASDDENSLSVRVIKAEHQLYAHALRGFIDGSFAETDQAALFSPNL